MQSSAAAPAKPTGLKRLLFKAPVLLYRAGLGWLLGQRFLLLVHRGRKSGRKRYTVLEVARFDPATRESVVTAAYGEASDWYRNIHAQPALEIRTGFDRYRPQQRFLDTEAAYDALTDYDRRHPAAFRLIARSLGLAYGGSEAHRREIAALFRVVAFRPSVPSRAQ
jgi:deazaflavin-dependent oxidoreductase (nitroreductase family)